MATATLTPSAYSLSSTYLQITDPSNMYASTSSTTYATLTNTDRSTSYYYCYINGFNIGDIPANAEVSSFTVKIKGRASGAYNSSLYLCNGSSTLSGATASQLPNSSSATTRTFSNGNITWANIVSYGEDFGIRVNCRRNARNTQSYYYIYGAEIDVTYTVPTPSTNKLFFKNNGAWVEAEKAYKKVNGVWVEQTDLTVVFDAGINYVKG